MLGRAAERFIRTKWASIQELAEELYATFSPEAPIVGSQIIINQPADTSQPPIVVNRGPGNVGPAMQINHNGGDTTFGAVQIGGGIGSPGGGFTFGNIDITGGNFGSTNFGPGSPNYGPSDFGFNSQFGPTNLGPPGGNPGGGLNFGGSTFNIGDFGLDPGGGYIGPATGGLNFGTLTIPGQDPGSREVAIPIPTFNPFCLYGEVQVKTSGSNHSCKIWAVSPLANAPPLGLIDVRFPMVDPSETINPDTPTIVLCFPGRDGGGIRSILDAIGFVPAFFA